MFSTQVPIQDTLPYTQASSTAGQTVYGTNWTANAASDVVVYYTPSGDAPDDATQILATSQYNVAFIGDTQQVQVTLITPANLGDIVTITRQTPADRENLYTNTNFIPSMLNNDFGILTLVDQQAQLVNQAIAPRYNYSATINNNPSYPTCDTILPLLGANQLWAKNPDNTAFIAVNLGEIISGGTVTQVNTGVGLTGGPITEVGTISFAPIAANSFWANTSGSSAVPSVTSLGAFLLSANNLSDLSNDALARINLGVEIGVNVQAYNAALESIAGLTTTANELLYTTASNTYAVISAADNAVLATSNSGIPSLTQTLPEAVQTNIQYLGEQNQNLNMGGFQINNGADPTQPTDFATKNYVDLNSLTGTSVYAASTTTLGTVTQSGSGVGATLTNAGSQATFALDGVNPPLNSNVLIKNTSTGATAANEGIYKVTNAGSNSTNWVLTRATTYDTPSEINDTGLIIVQNGTTLAGTAWYNANTIVTVDSTSFSYSEFGNIVFPVSLAHGGTNANLTATAGGIVYSTASAFGISSAGSSGQLFISAGTSAPGWTTSTYPTTNAANTLLYASSANTMAALATADSSVLVTSAGGVPSLSTTLPSGLTIPGFAKSGANNDITSMTDLTGYLAAPLGFKDSLGNIGFAMSYQASSVNYIQISNAATGMQPTLQTEGSDSTVNFNFGAKGGVFQFADQTATNPAQINLYNAADTHYVGLTVPSAQASNITFTLPGADGSAANCAIVTNASKVLSFTTKPVITKVVSQTFTTSGTYTPTSGMVYCVAEMVGGGGGGGGLTGTVGRADTAGGGGGGGYARGVLTAAQIGSSQTVTIGAGGTAGVAAAGTGGTGGSTSLGTLLIGAGGSGGAGGIGGQGGAAGGASGSALQLGLAGSPGGNGTACAIITVGPVSGFGGNSVWGGGAQAVTTTATSNGVNATANTGGGGSGANAYNVGTGYTGGVGGSGLMFITEYLSV